MVKCCSHSIVSGTPHDAQLKPGEGLAASAGHLTCRHQRLSGARGTLKCRVPFQHCSGHSMLRHGSWRGCRCHREVQRAHACSGVSALRLLEVLDVEDVEDQRVWEPRAPCVVVT